MTDETPDPSGGDRPPFWFPVLVEQESPIGFGLGGPLPIPWRLRVVEETEGDDAA